MTLLHKRAFVIAGLHYLISFALIIVGFATAWASAATGRSSPGLFEYVFYTLQPLWFVVTRLDVEFPLGAIFFLTVPSSLLYGYLIAYLLRPRPPNREDHDT